MPNNFPGEYGWERRFSNERVFEDAPNLSQYPQMLNINNPNGRFFRSVSTF